ncbi:MAG: hypothetical protein GXY85_12735 [Candidatus Brocadiaceae bacterium]|nr:hypothetical protein [Candidatus Brocadiaceae bacterium]
MRGTARLVCAACVVLLATTGCLVVRERTVAERGGAVATERLVVLQEGTTSVDDVVRAFGAPDQRVRFDDGREVLTYVYERTVRSELGVIFLLGWRSQRKRITRYSFEFQDGLLVRRSEEEVL